MIRRNAAGAIETINDQGVATQGERIVILLPRRDMSKPDALRFAAWLVALSEDEPGEFQLVLDAVQNC